MCRSVSLMDRSVRHRPDLLVTAWRLQEPIVMGVWTIAIPSTFARDRTENCCSAEICLGWPTVDGLHPDDVSIHVKLLLSSWYEPVVVDEAEHDDPQKNTIHWPLLLALRQGKTRTRRKGTSTYPPHYHTSIRRSRSCPGLAFIISARSVQTAGSARAYD